MGSTTRTDHFVSVNIERNIICNAVTYTYMTCILMSSVLKYVYYVCALYRYNSHLIRPSWLCPAGLASVISPTRVRRRCCVRSRHTSNSNHSNSRAVKDTTITRCTRTDTSRCPLRRPVGCLRAKTRCRPALMTYRHICSPCSTYSGPMTVWTW